MSISRSIRYFEKAGSTNTPSVIEAVKDRIRMGDVDTILVPVTTGKTSEQFSRQISQMAKIVTVSEEEATSACKIISYRDQGLLGKLVRERLEDASREAYMRRREAFDMTFLPFCGENWTPVREMLYAFGHGMKTAIEISIAAVEANKVKPYSRVVAVGGTKEGVDTAIVSRTSSQEEAFGKDVRTRLVIHEIIAMPTEKF